MKKPLVPISIFLIGAFLSGYFVLNSWDGKIFFYPLSKNGDVREPAALSRKLDISKFQGLHFKRASADRMLSEAKIVRDGKKIGLVLGNFIRVSSLGSKQFACDFYRFIELNFYAEGISVSGEPVEIKITTPCRYGEEPEKLQTIWFPKREEVEIADLRNPMLLGEQSTLEFKNFYGFWPERWTLMSLKLIRAPSSTDNVIIRNREIVYALKKQFSLNW